MASFFQNLAKLLGGPSKTGPQLHLAAFGKHPGWNDHIDDMGIDTEELVTVKRILYMQGINQNIDGATWEKLEPGHRLEKFRHNFLWYMPNAGNTLIAGRLWSSSDGKGRDKYPMVVCVETIDLPGTFAAGIAIPFLAKTEERCAAVSDADAVRRIIDADRQALRDAVATAPAPEGLRPSEVAKLANCSAMNPVSEGGGFHRIVYAILRTMAAYRPLNSSAATRSMIRRPEQIRVPTCGMSSHDALLFWLRFTLTLLDPATPMLLIGPEPEVAAAGGGGGESKTDSWIDILVGDPAPQNLFCLKAGLKQVPLTSEIPYTLDRSFTQVVDQYLQVCANAPPGAALPQWPPM